MKVLILAGGFGTRLSEETDIKPKPMVEIGGKPIIWHIMKTYSTFGFNEFVVLLGYKGYYIKEYFANYFLHQSDVSINIADGNVEVHNNTSEPWKITLLDTGLNSMTGSRIKKAKPYIGDEDFLLTYGDGVADIDIDASIEFHKSHGKIVTMTSAQPDGRFGALAIDSENTFKRTMIENGFELTEADNSVVTYDKSISTPSSMISANFRRGDSLSTESMYFIFTEDVFEKNDIWDSIYDLVKTINALPDSTSNINIFIDCYPYSK